MTFPNRIAVLSPERIQLDARRFQFRLGSGRQGDVGRLGGVQHWDPNLAGVISVWQDPTDDLTYVVNGHHRLLLARRLGVSGLLVRYLEAADADGARRIGALQNIAEGSSSALDAARFLRDSELDGESDLQALGLPLRSGMAAEGLALAQLPEDLFQRVLEGELSIEQGVILGGSGLDAGRQRALNRLVQERPQLRNSTLRELVASARQCQDSPQLEWDLFPADAGVNQRLLLRARLTEILQRQWRRSRRLLHSVSRPAAAQILEEQGGNRIDRFRSATVAREIEQVLGTFEALKHVSGPISDALNMAVAQLEQGSSEAEVAGDLEKTVQQAIAQLLPVTDSAVP